MNGTTPGRVDESLLASAADKLHEVAHCLEGGGFPGVSRHLFAAASEIDSILPAPSSAWWSGPFNGQDGRCHLFLDVLAKLHPVALLETGTYRGTTTDYMARQFGGPIFTCEADPRWYLTGRARLAGHANVLVRHQDSRRFLSDALAEAPAGPVFIYLDAHLFDTQGLFVDLPLREEIEIVAASNRAAVIIVDDFGVPDDTGYYHVDAGSGRALDVGLLAGLDHRGAGLFFPTLPSAEETGARRGCAVISTADSIGILSELPSLRRHEWPSGNAPAPILAPAAAAPTPDLSVLKRLVGSSEFERAAIEAGQRAAEVERRAAEAERHAAESAQRADEAAQRSDEAERRAAEAEQRAAEAAQRADEAERRAEGAVAESQRVAGQARREMEAILASTSWRISAPIRVLSRMMKN